MHSLSSDAIFAGIAFISMIIACLCLARPFDKWLNANLDRNYGPRRHYHLNANRPHLDR